MTKLLDHAVETVMTLPPEMQDQAAHMLLAYAGSEGPFADLTPEEEADLLDAQAEMIRGELATDDEVKGVLSSYRP